MLERIQSFLRGRTTAGDEPEATASEARIAAAALLVEMSRADFDVDESEAAAIERASARLLRMDLAAARELLTEARSRADESISLYDFTSLIQEEFPPEEKRNVILELWRVAYADGSLDPHEEHLVRKVAGLLHVQHEDFIDAKLRARDEETSPGLEG